VFGSLGVIVADRSDGTLKGAGVRVSDGRLFLEAQLDLYHYTVQCEIDDPCESRARAVRRAAAGFEIIHLRHFGLELRGEAIGLDRIFVLGTLAATYYL
jgi:hypothetical protein